MSAATSWWRVSASALLFACALSCLLFVYASSQEPPRPGTLVEHLQEHLGLNNRQARGALGALLVFAQERLHPTDFDELARSIPNAEHIVREARLQGVVTQPLDSVDDFETTLSNVGIGQPLASQIAPTVIAYLGTHGHQRERDLLARVMR
jgi:Protein of unknown function VcgC/VcgE (DUF2780)